MNIQKKLRWYRFDVARRIRNLEGAELIAVLEDIKVDITDKQLLKYGLFQQFYDQITSEINETKAKPKLKTREYDPFYIQKSGDGRIVLFGMTNVGKSTLMNAITNADVKTGNYLHTTRTVLGGTCEYKKIKMQLVDVPGFIDFREDWTIGTQILRVSRTCDAILLVIDLSQDVEPQYSFLLKQLEMAKIIQNQECMLKIGVVATKGDLPASQQNFILLQHLCKYNLIPISTNNQESLMQLKEFLFQLLDLIRIYTKPPNSKPDLEDPIICAIGSTIEDITQKIHKDLLKNFHYAKVWGSSVNFSGQHVGTTHELHDEDIMEVVVKK